MLCKIMLDVEMDVEADVEVDVKCRGIKNKGCLTTWSYETRLETKKRRNS